jgi:hypothetical protein
MPSPPPAPRGGGFILVAGLIGGTAIGFMAGQPTIGFLAGGVVGLVGLLIVSRRPS